MKVNAQKFQLMILPGDCSTLTLNVDAVRISPSKEMKLLGVTIDQNLNFSTHINNISCQAAKQINVLSRLSPFLSLQCRIRILDAFILSNLSYCCLAYHNCSITDARKLEKLFKRALRTTFLDFSSSYSELLINANKPSCYVSRLQVMLLTVYKIVNNMCPPISKDFFESRVTSYSLRNSQVLIQPAFNTIRHGYKSLRYQGSVLWNGLPDNVKLLDVDDFKSHVRNWRPVCHCGNCLLCTI